MGEFTIENTDSYEDVRYNEDEGCDEYLFEGEWYQEDDLIDTLKTSDFIQIECARGFLPIDRLELNFPASFYEDSDEDEDDEDEF